MLVVKQLFHNLCFCFFLSSGHFARSAMQMKRLKVSSSDYKYTDDSFVVVVVFSVCYTVTYYLFGFFFLPRDWSLCLS